MVRGNRQRRSCQSDRFSPRCVAPIAGAFVARDLDQEAGERSLCNWCERCELNRFRVLAGGETLTTPARMQLWHADVAGETRQSFDGKCDASCGTPQRGQRRCGVRSMTGRCTKTLEKVSDLPGAEAADWADAQARFNSSTAAGLTPLSPKRQGWRMFYRQDLFALGRSPSRLCEAGRTRATRRSRKLAEAAPQQLKQYAHGWHATAIFNRRGD